MEDQPIPEIIREPGGGVPWLGLLVVAILALTGIALVGFALYFGQQESETRAVNGTVAAILSYTATPTNTRPPTETPPPTDTPEPSATPTNTEPPTVGPTPTMTRTPTRTKPAQIVTAPTDTPVPPPPTATAAPSTTHGVTGTLTLCNPEKPSFAATIERVCFRELLVNHNSTAVSYGILGVQATNLTGGPNQFQTSWRGDLSIPANGVGPTGSGWEDGMYIDTAGTYRLTLSICYSNVGTCLAPSGGDWETLTSGVNVTVVNWTP